MRFLYLRDPLFLACVAIYFVNRWGLKSVWASGFVHDHLNDLLCIPFWVPVMLWGQRRLGLRGCDGPPLPSEILIPLFVWSWLFEVVLPGTGVLGRYCVSDHRDVLWYSVGALGAGAFWRWWYRGPESEQSRTRQRPADADAVVFHDDQIPDQIVRRDV